ncbi:hypothetical protein [Pseudomonas orientalis]|uniref:Uncharacterized protein n=1 Tax=Pseudomonas orientalis TaxID=76758 RepID=A0A2L0RTU3_9PSED|nr:hypothetical protein [Pseudomonas orientalis]AUZ45366.1 hypothetical protein BOP93_07065 [Pseudomonas orientalis]
MENSKQYDKVKAKFEKITAKFTPETTCEEMDEVLERKNLFVFHKEGGLITEITRFFKDESKEEVTINYITRDLLNGELVYQVFEEFDKQEAILQSSDDLYVRYNAVAPYVTEDMTYSQTEKLFEKHDMVILNRPDCIYSEIWDNKNSGNAIKALSEDLLNMDIIKSKKVTWDDFSKMEKLMMPIVILVTFGWFPALVLGGLYLVRPIH